MASSSPSGDCGSMSSFVRASIAISASLTASGSKDVWSNSPPSHSIRLSRSLPAGPARTSRRFLYPPIPPQSSGGQGPLAGEATRGAGFGRQHQLEIDGVQPAVTEVVLVPEPVTRPAEDLVEPDLPFIDADHALVDRCGHQVELGLRVVHALAAGELVQVAVGPAHHDLQDVVHPV